MSKLPTKQIYLLLIIIVGITTLSVYSTYAIFTLESETSNIVNIHTPNTLEISTEMYEYKQVTVPKNSYITSDIDLYNTKENELCYSIWYKIVGSADKSKVKIYQNTDENITTSGLIKSMNSKRISLIITNDNDKDIKVNVGVSSQENKDTCNLNITEDKSMVTETINNPKKLNEFIIENIDNKINSEEGYLTYKNLKKEIKLENPIYISEEFDYKEELFTLKKPEKVELKDVLKYISNEKTSYYTCFEDEKCKFLYKINNIETEEIKEENQIEIIYKITNYDEYIGYLKGESGIRKTKDNNYVYYGDNPNNFIYYNCKKEQDTKTCELWRIIGTYYDIESDKYITKIIRNDSIGKYQYNDNLNTWNDSLINKYLEKDYKINMSRFIQEIKVNQENILDLNTNLDKIPTITVDKASKISLLLVSDYLNASICQDKKINEYDNVCLNSNWLNKNDDSYEWTNSIKYTEEEKIIEEINPEETDEKEPIINNQVYSIGPSIKENTSNESLKVRPVVYLKDRILLSSGEGTLEKPYIIK